MNNVMMEIVKIMMVVAQIVKLKIYGHVINKFHYKIHYIIIPYVHYVEMEKEKEMNNAMMVIIIMGMDALAVL
jgi:hypothetical protein